MTYKLPQSREEAAELDAQDPLRDTRYAFDIDEGLIYLDGHSLGPASKAALSALETASGTEWRQGLIRSWNEAGWFDLARTTGARIARLIGVNAQEVIIADSVSTNLYKLAAAACPLARSRTLIVEDDEFPTDRYMIDALAGLSGAAFERASAGEGLTQLAATGGVLVKSLVNYRTAAVTDIASAENLAAEAGGIIVWDLSHATGVLALNLNGAGAKFAAGCTYKYLNGGPGAPAFLYVRDDMVPRVETPLPGWMGHARPFDFDSDYEAAPDIRRFANGTPPVLSLRALSGALDVFEGLDMETVEAKARSLGDLVLSRTRQLGLPAISPHGEARRGGHVSVTHASGYEIVQALIARNIIADFRAPDTIRFGVAPLYLSFVQVWDAMDTLSDILTSRTYQDAQYQVRAAVT